MIQSVDCLPYTHEEDLSSISQHVKTLDVVARSSTREVKDRVLGFDGQTVQATQRTLGQ